MQVLLQSWEQVIIYRYTVYVGRSQGVGILYRDIDYITLSPRLDRRTAKSAEKLQGKNSTKLGFFSINEFIIYRYKYNINICQRMARVINKYLCSFFFFLIDIRLLCYLRSQKYRRPRNHFSEFGLYRIVVIAINFVTRVISKNVHNKPI